MSTTSGSRNPVEALAEEFLERKRRGEEATPEDYAEQHPDLADEILALFPALLMMEDLGGDSAERTGSVLTDGGAIGGVTTGRLGEFRLLREVGRGGMGVVYEAEQESLGRRVALKVLPQGAITDNKQLRRFEREARSAARLHHTNIVPVFGVGQHDGTHFYVMQFIQGQGLDAVLNELRRLRDARTAPAGQPPTAMRTDRQRPAADIALSLATGRFAAGPGNGDPVTGTATLPWAAADPQPGLPAASETGQSSFSGVSTFTESDRKFAQGVARIGVQVAEALAYAHGQGILHRDIKPSNLLLDRDGNVWVADFGLAKAIGSDDLTHTGDIVGTVRYMAPERFQGVGDARADIYALGLTLYELLALRPAFDEADRAKLIHRVTQEDPPRLRKLNRHAPPDLETIVHKSIAREPAQRYATAQAVVEDLNRFLEGRPILARRVSKAEQAWRWCRRNPWLAGLSAALLLALVSGTIVSSMLAARATDQAQRAELEAARANKSAAELKTSLEVSARRLSALSLERSRSNFDRGRAASERGEIGPALLYWVESWRSAVEAGDPALARAARGSLSAWRHQSPRLVRLFPHTDKGTVQNVVLSPDGKTVATVGNDNLVRLWEAASGQPIGSPILHQGRVYAMAFSPDGKKVLTSSADKTARLWEAASGQPIGPPLTHQGEVYAVAFSPDGKTVLTGSDDNTVRLWVAASGKPIGAPKTHSSYVLAVAFSPDGKTVITGSADQTARLWGAASGKLIGAPMTHQGYVYAVAFSPDGKTVLTGSADKTARLWDAASGQPIGAPMTHQGNVYGVAFSPDGKTVLTGSIDKTARLWEATTGRPISSPMTHQGAVNSVGFSRDGKLAFTGATDSVRVWDAATGQPAALPVQDQEALMGFDFSPDGRAVLTTAGDGTARLWDTTTVGPLGLPLTHQGPVHAVAMSPDGKTVLTGSFDQTARLWDVAGGQPIGPPLRHQGLVYAVEFSPDGKTVLTGSADRTARLWKATSGQPIGAPMTHRGRVSAVEFSPDGKTVLTGSVDQTARLWEAASGQPIGSPMMHQGYVYAVAFSPDGKSVLTGSADKTARLWDAATGEPFGSPMTHQGSVHAVAYSPDGKSVLTGSYTDGNGNGWTARLWEAASGQPIGSPMMPQGFVYAVAYSPDGKSVLTVSLDGVRIWDASSGRQIGSPITQRERILCAALSRDGRRILTGSADNSARLWDAATGQPLGPPLPHQGSVRRAMFSPDGRTALCAGGNEARLWDVAELPDDLPLLESWVHVNTGLALDEQGQVKHLDAAAWHEQGNRLTSLGGAPESEPRWRLDPILFGSEPTARAKAWVERQRWAEAEAAFTEAVAARPHDAAIRLERARFYTSRSQPEKAAEDYARSYTLGERDPKLIDAIVASEPLLLRVVAESPGSAGSLWAKHGELMVSQSRWDDAAADFARELEHLPEDRGWNSERALRALKLARWDRAYSRLLELRPEDGQIWSVRGRYHVQRGLWNEAAADFARGVASAPTNSEEWFEHACLRLIVGDDEGYRAAVRELERRASHTKDPFQAFVLARTAGMTREPVVDPEQAIRWAKLAVAARQVGWYLHALGLAHYRAGQFAAAIQPLEESNAGSWEERGKMQNMLVLALAHHRLGHAAQSRALLDEVERWWKSADPTNADDNPNSLPAVDWLPLQLLRSEAEALILYDPIFPADPFAH